MIQRAMALNPQFDSKETEVCVMLRVLSFLVTLPADDVSFDDLAQRGQVLSLASIQLKTLTAGYL